MHQKMIDEILEMLKQDIKVSREHESTPNISPFEKIMLSAKTIVLEGVLYDIKEIVKKYGMIFDEQKSGDNNV